eukprot:bmy_03742T0
MAQLFTLNQRISIYWCAVINQKFPNTCSPIQRKVAGSRQKCIWDSLHMMHLRRNILQLLDRFLSSSKSVPCLNSWSSSHPLTPQIKKK